MAKWDRPQRVALIIGALGILVEIVGIVLLVSKRIDMRAAMPIIVAGMFIAFVPIFVLSRRARR